MAVRLFQSQTSMFCEKVRIVMALKKVPYEIVDVRKDERKSLIEYTGQRKVPSMDFNGQCVIDSTVISALMEDKYPGAESSRAATGPGALPRTRRLVRRSFDPCESRDPAR